MTAPLTDSLRACEDCGGRVVVGPEPTHALGFAPSAGSEVETQLVDFCINLACPSNHLQGLTRVGVNRYVCTACGVELSGAMTDVFAHRREH